jgi:F420-dependent methylenetetrahydromethanopterin dehydrogenase
MIRIVRQTRSGDPSRPYDFLVSFGGKKDSVGAFYVGMALGIDDLIRLLPKVGVSQGEIDQALEVLKAHSHHEIPNVKITKDFLSTLGS